MSKKETEVIIEELEALKLINGFETQFTTSDLSLFCTQKVLHMIAKDSALICISKIIELHITQEHNHVEYWKTVKEYIEIL